MQYSNVVEGIFLSRPNRFIAHVEVEGRVVIAHVKNTGRCKELLIPGCRVFLEYFDSSKRKTNYDLIAVYKGELLINMDSQAPNKLFREWIAKAKDFADITYVKPEYTIGDSRLDYYLEAENRKLLVEVKGVTLEEEGIAKFPDAPTERGIKHIKELTRLVSEGYDCTIAFVIQMKGCRVFSPNTPPHFDFRNALLEAQKAGVKLLAFDCIVTEDSITPDALVEIQL